MKKIYSRSPRLRRVHMNICDILIGFADLLVNQFMAQIMFWVEALIVVLKVVGYLDWHWVLVVLHAVLYIGLCIVFGVTRKYIYMNIGEMH